MSNTDEFENIKERLKEAIVFFKEKIIANLPVPLRAIGLSELEKFEEIIVDIREPRFVIVGRRGSGKSSLINAIFGSKVADVGSVKSMTGTGKWYDYTDDRGTISVLDTRGLGEGSIPDELTSKESAEEEVKSSINDKQPDAILFLCKGKEVDARIDEDIKSLNDIKSYVYKKYNYKIPVLVILTQVDELDPPDIIEPPYDDEEKQSNISHAKEHLSEKIKSTMDDIIEVIPVSAYMRFSADKIVYDRRWNVDKLVEYLYTHLPKSAQMQFARITRIKSVQKIMARTLIGSVAALTGLVGATPIPLADLPVITSMQIGMLMGIGYIGGRTMNKDTALEFLASMGVNVGLSFAFREAARALAKLIPVAGNIVAGGVAATATYGLGEASIAYFIDLKSPEEAKRIYEEEKAKRN